MVAVPAGRVVLSDRRTRRRWEVAVEPFRLAAVPVTRQLHALVSGERPSDGDWAGQRPVDSVSWWDAVRFCNALSRRDGRTPAYRLDGGVLDEDMPAGDLEAATGRVVWERAADGYRLPTEAEWEHACRAGTTGPRYGPLDQIGWYRHNSGGRSQDVGGKLPNAWGLHDMIGNAWDWCWDVYDAEVYGSYRVLRGGGWFDEHWSCRASVRRRSHPAFRVDDVSFRVAHAG